jgi:hypothetical protein
LWHTGKAPNAAGLRKRPFAEKGNGLATLSDQISAYGEHLTNTPLPAATGAGAPVQRPGLQPGPPGAGLKPPVAQAPPAAKPNKGKGGQQAKKKTTEKKTKAKESKQAKKKNTIEESDEEVSNDDESDEDEESDEEDDLEEGVYIVEAILGERAEGKVMQYLVKWQGFEGEDTWEPTSALKDNLVFKDYKKAAGKKDVLAPAAKLTAAKLAAAAIKLAADDKRAADKHAAHELAAPAEPAAELAAQRAPRSARVACSAPIARRCVPIAQQLNFLYTSMDALSAACASADVIITDADKVVPKPTEEASSEASVEETAARACAFVAPPVARRAVDEQSAKRPRKGGVKRFAWIELDEEDGPPQIRSLPLEAGPFAGVWVPDGDQFEIIGDLINDSAAGEIYQHVLYKYTSGYIKHKYIRYATEN